MIFDKLNLPIVHLMQINFDFTMAIANAHFVLKGLSLSLNVRAMCCIGNSVNAEKSRVPFDHGSNKVAWE